MKLGYQCTCGSWRIWDWNPVLSGRYTKRLPLTSVVHVDVTCALLRRWWLQMQIPKPLSISAQNSHLPVDTEVNSSVSPHCKSTLVPHERRKTGSNVICKRSQVSMQHLRSSKYPSDRISSHKYPLVASHTSHSNHDISLLTWRLDTPWGCPWNQR